MKKTPNNNGRPHLTIASSTSLPSHVARQLTALEHIHYEIQMFIDLTPLALIGSHVMSNAILESWLIHLRTLDEFLNVPTASKRKDDDVRAGDYDVVIEKRIISDADRTRLHKEVAHLTYSRSADHKLKQWGKAAIYCEAWPILREAITQILQWIDGNPVSVKWNVEFAALVDRGDAVDRMFQGHVTADITNQ